MSQKNVLLITWLLINYENCGGFLFFSLPVPRGVGNPHFESNTQVLRSVAEGPVSYKLTYLSPVMCAALKLIQDCEISLLRFCNEYPWKRNPPLILGFENNFRKLKVISFWKLKYYESHFLDVAINSVFKSEFHTVTAVSRWMNIIAKIRNYSNHFKIAKYLS